jgi:hypothetical protein
MMGVAKICVVLDEDERTTLDIQTMMVMPMVPKIN